MIVKFISSIFSLCLITTFIIFKLISKKSKTPINMKFVYFNIYFWFSYSIITILLIYNKYIYFISGSILAFLLSLFFWISYINTHPTEFFKKYFWLVYFLGLLFSIATIITIKFNHTISIKEIPDGLDGISGNRGKIGNTSKTGTDSEICYQHLIFHIDGIFDSWRSNRNQIINTNNSGVNNIYFKDNIKRISESSEFIKMVNDNFKYSPCPITNKKGLDRCYHSDSKSSETYNSINTYHGLNPTIEYLKNVVEEWIYYILGNDRVLINSRGPNIVKWIDPLTKYKYDVDDDNGSVYLLEEPADYLGNRKQCDEQSNRCITTLGNNNEYIKVGYRRPNNKYGHLTPNGYKRGQHFLEDYSSTDFTWDTLLYKARPYYELDNPFLTIKKHPVWKWKKCSQNKQCD